jgi:hypothetical protein
VGHPFDLGCLARRWFLCGYLDFVTGKLWLSIFVEAMNSSVNTLHFMQRFGSSMFLETACCFYSLTKLSHFLIFYFVAPPPFTIYSHSKPALDLSRRSTISWKS